MKNTYIFFPSLKTETYFLLIVILLQQWIIIAPAFEDKQLLYYLAGLAQCPNLMIECKCVHLYFPGYTIPWIVHSPWFSAIRWFHINLEAEIAAFYLSLFWVNICKVAMGFAEFYFIFHFINKSQRWTKLLIEC